MKIITSTALAAVLVFGATAGSFAQTTQTAATTQAPLPPALQAALSSGNPDAITRAIQILSGGDSAKASTLALQVVTAAEKLMAVNPQAAVGVAAAAINIVQTTVTANAQNAQSASAVIAVAARIMVNPVALRIAPQVCANLSVSVAQVASNPAVFAANPTAAVLAMNTAANVASSEAVVAIAPNALQTVTATLQAASTNPQIAQIATTAGIQLVVAIPPATANTRTVIQLEVVNTNTNITLIQSLGN